MLQNKKTKLTAKNVIIYAVTFRWLVLGLIRIYKIILSPHIGNGCIYFPTCSTYCYDAVKRFGTLRGSAMGIYRIMRCNPLSKGGLDLVPDNPQGDLKWTF